MDIDKKIMSEIYTSSEPMDNLEILCDEYGSRFPGTPGDIGSVKYMVEKLKSYGLENAYYEKFMIPGWRRGPATLEVTYPIKKSFEVISLPHSIAGEIETKLVDLGPGGVDVYEARKDEIEGNIALVTNARPPGMTRSLHRSEKYSRSVLAGAKGWIYMNQNAGMGPITGGVTPIIPALGMGYEDGCFLQRLVKRKGEVKVRIKTTDKNLDVETYNVIGDVEGTSSDKEYVMTGCHYDGHDIAQGTIDPASGTVVVLEMARVLSMVKDKIKRRIRFLCFGAEETGLYGSTNYANVHENELSDCRFMLNLDAAGGYGRKGMNFNNFPELTPVLENWAEQMKADMPITQSVSPYSDHWPFFNKSVPTGTGMGPAPKNVIRIGMNFGHTKYDTLDKADLTYLRLASANYSRFLLRVANTDNWIAKRKSKAEIDGFIEKMGYGDTVKLVDRLHAYIKTWDEIHPETQDWLNRKSAW